MADLKITDALTGDIIEFDFGTQGAQVVPTPGASAAVKATSLFFPGSPATGWGGGWDIGAVLWQDPFL